MRQGPYREVELYQCVANVVAYTTTLQNFPYALILETSFLTTPAHLALIQVFVLQLRHNFSFFLVFANLSDSSKSQDDLPTWLDNSYGLASTIVQSLKAVSLDDWNYTIHIIRQP